MHYADNILPHWGVKYGPDSGPFGALARRDFSDLEIGVTAREARDASPRQLEQLGMDAAAGAPRADKGFVAVGDKRANCLCNRLVGIGGKVLLSLVELLDKFGILPGECTVDVGEADIAMLFGDVVSRQVRERRVAGNMVLGPGV